jgi:hypothetical protein
MPGGAGGKSLLLLLLLLLLLSSILLPLAPTAVVVVGAITPPLPKSGCDDDPTSRPQSFDSSPCAVPFSAVFFALEPACWSLGFWFSVSSGCCERKNVATNSAISADEGFSLCSKKN